MDTANYYVPPAAGVDSAGEIEEAGLVPQSVVVQLKRNQGWLNLVSILCFLLAVICISGGLAGVWGAWRFREMSKLASDVGSTENWAFILLSAIAVIVQGRLLLAMWVRLRRQIAAVQRMAVGRALADLQRLLENQRKFWRLTAIWGLLVVVSNSIDIWTQIAAFLEPSDKEVIEERVK